MLDVVDRKGREAISRIGEQARAELGQYFTPAPIARLMASMITQSGPSLSVLEPGAGVGILISATLAELVQREQPPERVNVTAYELDDELIPYLTETIDSLKRECEAQGIGFDGRIIDGDFIRHGVTALSSRGLDLFAEGPEVEYDLVIANPPYRKLNTDSEHRRLLSSVGIETSNLYTAFLAISIQLLKDGGEIIAIVPRSFCNGRYFRPFRELLLHLTSIQHIHLFESRRVAFRDDDVLQENVIFRAKKMAERGRVIVSVGNGAEDPIETRVIDHDQLVWPGDPQSFIHIVPDSAGQAISDTVRGFRASLEDLGLCVSTGRVVDFRARQQLRMNPEPHTVPLIYPTHFKDGFVSWPKPGKKPNALVLDDYTRDQVVPVGHYVLVKRFSSKEERRRIVAAVFDPCNMPEIASVGFENHLNYFHHDNRGIDPVLAMGLAVYLNSSLVDAFFRQFSGHTQVNAGDLQIFNYPTRHQLFELGRRVGDEFPSQDQIDSFIEEVLMAANEPELDRTAATDQLERRRLEALEILRSLRMPRQQQNDRSAHTLLALLDLTPEKPWQDARNRLIGIHGMMDWIAEHYAVRYAENSRETIRRETLHQLVQAAIIEKNPDDPMRPINSPKTVYRVTPAVLDLVRAYGSPEWDDRLGRYLNEVNTLAEKYAQARERNVIEVNIAPGLAVLLSAGGQNPLIKQVVEEFVPQFIQQPRILYIGDARAKQGVFDEAALEELGLRFDRHGQMPDVIIHDGKRDWLVLVEAVTSHGPVNTKRLLELKELFKNSRAGLVFVTAFPDRKTFGKYQTIIAWETEVWIAEDPTHMIHYNGERFLGPY
jgi:adenine-specific DNA-methyltransferase